jgi:hypothetical protein
VSSTPVFSILARGPWSPANVHVEVGPGRLPFGKHGEEALERAWQAATRLARDSGRTLFPGEIFGLTSFAATRDTLALALHRTDYREFVGTNLAPDPRRALGLNALPQANPLGLSLVVLSGDTVLLHRRGAGCYEWPLAIDTPGGHLEPGKHVDSAGIPRPELGALDELESELGVLPAEVESISVLGLARQAATEKPQLVIALRITLGAEDVRSRLARARESFETSELLPVDRRELAALARSKESVSPAGRAALVLASEVLP